MQEVILDTIFDILKLLPFLFVAFFIMEYLEHKTKEKTKNIVKNAGKLGPLFGSVVGIVPQCGFSAAAANLYSARIITLGTLIAVFLSTSDEMVPILISQSAPINVIVKILIIKLILGMLFGFLVDAINSIRKKKEKTAEEAIGHICEHEHCDCEHEGILKSSIKHTLSITFFILIITFIINVLIYLIGEEKISELIVNIPVIGVMVSCLIGLIPNCASSVIITELYLSNLINFGTMIAGLLVGSGVGILILFKTNKNLKQNILITLILYLIGVISGIIINII